VAESESTDPAAFDTRTQNVVVSVSGGVSQSVDVAPVWGDEVRPRVSSYHWYLSGPAPLARTRRIAVSPARSVPRCGCDVIVGGVPVVTVGVTVIVAVDESIERVSPVIRTQ